MYVKHLTEYFIHIKYLKMATDFYEAPYINNIPKVRICKSYNYKMNSTCTSQRGFVLFTSGMYSLSV
jgi:hypothetical protein